MNLHLTKFNKAWVQVIRLVIHWNELILFYPKLKKFYRKYLTHQELNIIDVGANRGQSIDFFLGIHPKVNIHSFEPNKRLFELLKDKYHSKKEVKLIDLGISDKIGKSLFYENLIDLTSSLEEVNPKSKYLDKKAKILGVEKDKIIVDQYQIDVITISSFLNEHPNTYFDVLKIDVEGHELSCLNGLFNSDRKIYPIRFIQLERHNDDMYLSSAKFEEIDDLSNENGFIKVKDIKHGFGDFSELVYENCNKR
jgi:FkbM family methyltransferase